MVRSHLLNHCLPQINISEVWAVLAAVLVIVLPVVCEVMDIAKARNERRHVADVSPASMPTTSEVPDSGCVRRDSSIVSVEPANGRTILSDIEELPTDYDSGKAQDPREPVFS